MNSTDETMGQRIARQLEVKNLSQAEFARILKVSRVAVGQWVHDISEPTPVNLLNIAHLLFDGDACYLVRGVPRTPADHAPAQSVNGEQAAFVPSVETKKETVGERLRRLRVKKGWSLRKAAKQIGVSYTAVDKWEKGENLSPRAETLYVIAQAYGTAPEYILGIDPRKPASGERGHTSVNAPNPAGMLDTRASPAVAEQAPRPVDFVRMYTQLPKEERAEIRALIEMIEAFASRKP